MTEHPIIFSAPMVLALLAGRKTMTRRVVKPQPEPFCRHVERFRGEGGGWIAGDNTGRIFRCPYGDIGGALWVKEAFRVTNWDPDESRLCIRYEADGVWRWVPMPEDADPDGDVFNRYWEQGVGDLAAAGYEWDEDDDDTPAIWRGEGPEPKEVWSFMRLRPSIHMPRWASRITLDITSIRVERLQDITPADAIAEGMAVVGEGMGMPLYDCGPLPIGGYGRSTDPSEAFMYLWDGLNARRPGCRWGANPRVWVVEFSAVGAGKETGDG